MSSTSRLVPEVWYDTTMLAYRDNLGRLYEDPPAGVKVVGLSTPRPGQVIRLDEQHALKAQLAHDTRLPEPSHHWLKWKDWLLLGAISAFGVGIVIWKLLWP